MMAFDFEPAKKFLGTHVRDLNTQLAGATTGQQYLNDFINATTAPNPAVDEQDRRLASQMAVDMSKAFIQIALGGIAALVAYSQVTGYPTGFGLSFWAWVVTLVLLVLSMIAGAVVISKTAKRGGGKKALGGKSPWDIGAVGFPMNAQALVGLLAVLSFIVLVLARNAPPTAKRFEVDLPGGGQFVTSGQIEIHGQWQSLYVVDKRTDYILQLAPSKVGQDELIKIIPNK